jgi:hypothetical protein
MQKCIRSKPTQQGPYSCLELLPRNGMRLPRSGMCLPRRPLMSTTTPQLTLRNAIFGVRLQRFRNESIE